MVGLWNRRLQEIRILPVNHHDTSSDGSLDKLYQTSWKWKVVATWQDDAPDYPLQRTLLDPEVHKEQLVQGIASDLCFKVEI